MGATAPTAPTVATGLRMDASNDQKVEKIQRQSKYEYRPDGVDVDVMCSDGHVIQLTVISNRRLYRGNVNISHNAACSNESS